MAKLADTYMIYQVLKRLTTPFDETKAFELGIIDKNGKLLKNQKHLKIRMHTITLIDLSLT